MQKVSLGILPKGHSSFLEGDYDISGHGEAGVRCGLKFVRGCLNSHLHKGFELGEKVVHQKRLDGGAKNFGVYGRVFRHKCYRQDCPVCYKVWAGREAKRGARRIRAFKIKGRKLKPIHAMVSVPFVDYGLNESKMRKKVYKVLKNVHVLGGMLIFHPKRYKPSLGWFYSPHYHVVCYGFIQDVRKNYIESGYVIKNLGVRNTLEGTIWYQLSHAGYKKGKKTVNWFGCLYNKKKLGMPVELKEKFVCPICGSDLCSMVHVGGKDFSGEVEGFEFYDDSSGWVYVKDLGGGKYP